MSNTPWVKVTEIADTNSDQKTTPWINAGNASDTDETFRPTVWKPEFEEEVVVEGIDRYYRFTGGIYSEEPAIPSFVAPGHPNNGFWCIAMSGDGLTLAFAVKPSSSTSTWKTTNIYIYRRTSYTNNWTLYASFLPYEIASEITGNFICLSRDGTRLVLVCSAISPFQNRINSFSDNGTTFVDNGIFGSDINYAYRQVVMSDDGNRLHVVRRHEFTDFVGDVDTFTWNGTNFALTHQQIGTISDGEPSGDVVGSSCLCKFASADNPNSPVFSNGFTQYKELANGDFAVVEAIPPPAGNTVLRPMTITRGGEGIIALGAVSGVVRFYIYNWNGTAWIQDPGFIIPDVFNANRFPVAHTSDGKQAIHADLAFTPPVIYTFNTGMEAYDTVPACNTAVPCT